MAGYDFALGTAGSEVLMSANEAQMQMAIEDIVREARMAGGTLKRYKILKARHWQWRYGFIYGKKRDVYDGGMGRDDLFALYVADNEMSLLMPSDNAAQTSYTVRFAANSWRERIVFRAGDIWAYELSFELVQVS